MSATSFRGVPSASSAGELRQDSDLMRFDNHARVFPTSCKTCCNSRFHLAVIDARIHALPAMRGNAQFDSIGDSSVSIIWRQSGRTLFESQSRSQRQKPTIAPIKAREKLGELR